MIAVEVENLSLTHENNSILQDVSFRIGKGESWIFLGRNGSGKSTLIQMIYGSRWPTSGTVRILGDEYGTTAIAPIQGKMGILQGSLQEQLTQRTLTVSEIVLTGLYSTLGLYKDPTADDLSRVESLLQKNGWGHKQNQRYSTLSSGEKIQILLLRSLVKNPEILILDEPTSNLDLTARVEFFQMLEKIKTQYPKLTILMILHRIEEIPSFFTHILLLKKGRLIGNGRLSDVLNSKSISALYDLNLKLEISQNSYQVSIL